MPAVFEQVKHWPGCKALWASRPVVSKMALELAISRGHWRCAQLSDI
jgi:hypothetical protein